MDILPDDIIKCVMLKSDIKNIFLLCGTCKKLNSFCQPMVSEILSAKTGLNTRNYTLKQLHILYLNNSFGDKRIVYKYGRTLIVKNNGEVFIMGLIDGKQCCEPKIVKDIKDVIKADIGEYFEVFLTKEGKVYTSNDICNIVLHPGIKQKLNLILDDVINISAGGNYILMLLSDGRVMGIGSNYSNQLGIKNKQIILEPTLIPNLKNIVEFGTVTCTSYFVSNDDKIYQSHINSEIKELISIVNINKFLTNIINVTILQLVNEKLHPVIFNTDPWKENTKYTIDSNLNIINISTCGTILYLDNNGDVYINGWIEKYIYKSINEENLHDDFMLINSATKIKGLKDIIYIYNGGCNWFFVDISYNLYVMGRNNHGVLGIGNLEKINKPTINTNIII